MVRSGRRDEKSFVELVPINIDLTEKCTIRNLEMEQKHRTSSDNLILQRDSSGVSWTLAVAWENWGGVATLTTTQWTLLMLLLFHSWEHWVFWMHSSSVLSLCYWWKLTTSQRECTLYFPKHFFSVNESSVLSDTFAMSETLTIITTTYITPQGQALLSRHHN